MRVLAWLLVWTALLAGSAWYLWRRLRRLGRTGRRLGAELSEAEQVLTSIQREAAAVAQERSGGQSAANTRGDRELADLAVFTAIPQAMAERRAVRTALRQAKQARRAARLPGWARRVDSNQS